jgi:UPF0176 protein
MPQNKCVNLSFYSFFTVPSPELAAQQLKDFLQPMGVLGSIILAPEGINLYLAHEDDAFIEQITAWLKSAGCVEFDYKLSYSETQPFDRFKIKLKKEICTLGLPELDVKQYRSEHISADEFEKLLENPGDTLILDNRNDFEYAMGTFNGATPAGTNNFREFPNIVPSLPKDKPIVMFCTGGIRCEKASAFLQSQGFSQVRQLKGGILRYLEEKGGKNFQGHCFVFDDRVAVDGQLNEWGS